MLYEINNLVSHCVISQVTRLHEAPKTAQLLEEDLKCFHFWVTIERRTFKDRARNLRTL